MPEDNSSFLNYINSSGFAFQMRIEEEILKGQNRWQFAGREHRWQDENGQNGYIDLVVDSSALRVLIECKRQKDKNWIFLKSQSSQQKGKCSLLWTKKYKPINNMPFPADFLAWDISTFRLHHMFQPFAQCKARATIKEPCLKKQHQN